MKPCKHTSDGYCIRNEKDYCNSDECKGCNHTDTSIVVIAAAANCETTVLKCDDCDKVLTKPKIECL
ncbi:hypothetical protein FIA58_013955 [Flavobacterium jejuense]|uniref:DUF1540 domain-containing protein n=1 Tax=Flavobacterium jejuense TaxID=1544455 RepID=A0ABX0IUG3_9FLAO|nr:hypothetical protein [Flavobacterium jejuense]NHN26785.1 hypothetical protein [Flavobacterium jejuense]